MPNSIRTTSNTQTPTNSTPATFKAGDSVLWAAVSNDTYKLQSSSDKRSNRLFIRHANIEYSFDTDGRSSPDDALPSLFHNTPANRQAIQTLYGSNHTATSNGLKTIDITEADEDEAVLMSSMALSNIACDIEGAATILEDLGDVLHMIYQKKVSPPTARSLARLAHDSTCTWAELLYSRLEIINEPLSQSKFGKVGA